MRSHPGALTDVFVWFAAGSVAIVWAVFQSPMIDYRMVMVGSVVALVEVPFGSGPLHTLAGPTLVLVGVMAATVGRRLVRRRWLGVPIGMFLHLVLDGAWGSKVVFWWPAYGWSFGGRTPEVGRGVWSLILEAAGGLLAVWLWGRFGLDDAGRRERFVRTGQLDRSVMPTGGRS